MLTLFALMMLTPAQDRFQPEVEQAIMAVDLDGFSTGQCWAFLSEETQGAVSVGHENFEARPPRPRPVLDQVFYGALDRGKASALREAPDQELCDILRQEAADDMARQADALRAFEESLHPSLRRTPSP